MSMLRPRLRDRSTSDLLVLMIAGVVCVIVVGSTGVLIVGEIIDPDVDRSDAASQINDIINTLIGLLAGFLAGRTEMVRRNGNGNGLTGSSKPTPPPSPED